LQALEGWIWGISAICDGCAGGGKMERWNNQRLAVQMSSTSGLDELLPAMLVSQSQKGDIRVFLFHGHTLTGNSQIRGQNKLAAVFDIFRISFLTNTIVGRSLSTSGVEETLRALQ
jgi:hypothetical protein